LTANELTKAIATKTDAIDYDIVIQRRQKNNDLERL